MRTDRNLKRVSLRLLFIALSLSLPAHSATLFVSPDGSGVDGLSWVTAFNSVQEGILAAGSGDQVWVRSATYVENVTIERSIALLGGFAGNESSFSERDWVSNDTIMDGSRAGAVIKVTAGADCRIDGFHITNGAGGFGGGIAIKDATAEIRHCKIYDNQSFSDPWTGGGIGVEDGETRITNSAIFNNSSAVVGGGMAINKSTAMIEDCQFNGNDARDGGGIGIKHSNVTLSNSRLFGNSAVGGGLSSFRSQTQITNCIIERNLSQKRGGGCYFVDSHATIEGSMFLSNEAIEPWYPPPHTDPIGGKGAALYFVLTNTADIHNCLFVDNLSDVDQCAYIGVGENEVVFRNCTILARRTSPTYNRSAMSWVRSQSATPPTLINCIVDGVISIPHPPISTTANVTYSSMKNGYPGEGNIDADPMFVDPENGDFRLMRGSPCIDSGTDTGLVTDLDGNPRPIGRGYDMGAFEFASPYYSDINKDGVVDALDLMILQADWMKVSGP